MKGVTTILAGTIAVAAGAAAMLAAGCGQPAGRGESASAPPPVAPAALASNGMRIRWQTGAILAPGTHLTHVWVRRGYVVCHGSDHRVYVIDAETGVRLWSAVLAASHETVWPPALHGDRLWFATTTRLMGFRGSDGKNIVQEALTPSETVLTPETETAMTAKPAGQTVQWAGAREAARRVEAQVARLERHRADLDRLLAHETEAIDLEFGPSGPPATDGSHVFIPDAKGWLQAVSIRPQIVSWGRWTGDAVTAGPVVDATRVYFASHNGTVYASTQNVRRILWEYQTEGPVTADLRMTETGILLAGSLDYSLYAFDGASGVPEWSELPNRRYNAGEPIRKPPYTFGEQVFLFTARAGLTVLDTTTGKVRWQLADGYDLITADAETVYVLGRGNDLLAVDRQTGEVRFAIPLRPGALVGINETGTGMLYLATPEGQVLAVRKATEEEKAEEEEEPVRVLR